MRYITVILLSCFIWLVPHLQAATTPAYTCVKSIETEDCFICFLVDARGEQFVVKQIKNLAPDEQFLLVIDAVGCQIAEQMSMPMNRVCIIGAEIVHVGKRRSDSPATLHTFARGISTEEEACPYYQIDLHQRFRKENSPMWRKYGPLAPEATGLTLAVIQNMAKHPDLPQIVALDTFVGNADRSPPNLFYDPESDHFCGIDMAASFNTELAKEACRQIEGVIRARIPFSAEEKVALREYVRILKALLYHYPPHKQITLLFQTGHVAGFKPGSPLWDKNLCERLHHHRKRIYSNYKHAQRLVLAIERLLKNQ